jgi:hypothetical protein
MNRLSMARAAGLNLLLIGLLWSQGAQRQPNFHTPPPKPTSAYDQPLTGYEVAILTAEFVVNLERGLTEAFQKPISLAGAGEARLEGRHPAWAQPALKELKARGAIPPRFSAGKPMPRYQVGQMLAQYAQRLDARMREQLGAPRGVTASARSRLSDWNAITLPIARCNTWRKAAGLARARRSIKSPPNPSRAGSCPTCSTMSPSASSNATATSPTWRTESGIL